jgi:hypothetical protein
MAFGIDDSRKEMFASEIDLTIRRRQKFIAPDSGNPPIENRNTTFDGTAGSDDTAISKNEVGCLVDHESFSQFFYFLASAR